MTTSAGGPPSRATRWSSSRRTRVARLRVATTTETSGASAIGRRASEPARHPTAGVAHPVGGRCASRPRKDGQERGTDELVLLHVEMQPRGSLSDGLAVGRRVSLVAKERLVAARAYCTDVRPVSQEALRSFGHGREHLVE